MVVGPGIHFLMKRDSLNNIQRQANDRLYINMMVNNKERFFLLHYFSTKLSSSSFNDIIKPKVPR